MSRAAAREPARPANGGATLFAWMEALGDPTRLRALRVLERQELSVLELCEALASPQSTVSRHLKILADGGWVAARREGTQAFYAWSPELDPGARRLWLVARGESEGWPVVRQDAGRLTAVLARRDGAHRFFAGAAGAWDGLRAQVYGRGFGAEALVSLLPSSWTVADLGCGTGAVTAELAGRVRRVIAVDRSAAMLKAARKRTEGLANVSLHEADLAALPLEPASCDAALLVLVLAYLDAPAPVLAEAARVLRPGGRLVVVDAARHLDEALRRKMGQVRPGFDPDDLAALLRGAGLVPDPVRTLPPEPGAKGPGLVVCAAGKAEHSRALRSP